MSKKQLLEEISLLQDVVLDVESLSARDDLQAAQIRKWTALLEFVAEQAKKLSASKSAEVLMLTKICVVLAESLGEMIVEREENLPTKRRRR